jgi:hypothetical protein
LQTIKNGREYGEIQLSTDDGPGVLNTRLTVTRGNWTSAGPATVNPDMVFDLARRHLYVMTKNEVSLIFPFLLFAHFMNDTCIIATQSGC